MSSSFNVEAFLRRLRRNQVVWLKKDSNITYLAYWKRTFPCEVEGCNERTHLTSHSVYEGEPGVGHAVCSLHYQELHAYHIAVREPNGR